MKSLNLLRFFNYPSILAFAMLIGGVFVFSSNASANEKNFDVLSGVTAETMSPAAMDAIQGMGSIHVHYDFEAIGARWPHTDIVGLKTIGDNVNIVINLAVAGSGKVKITRN